MGKKKALSQICYKVAYRLDYRLEWHSLLLLPQQMQLAWWQQQASDGDLERQTCMGTKESKVTTTRRACCSSNNAMYWYNFPVKKIVLLIFLHYLGQYCTLKRKIIKKYIYWWVHGIIFQHKRDSSNRQVNGFTVVLSLCAKEIIQCTKVGRTLVTRQAYKGHLIPEYISDSLCHV